MLRHLIILLLGIAPLPSVAADRPPVTHAVLVHGIFQNGNNTFGFLCHDLERRGVTCLRPKLDPPDLSVGLVPLAQQLRSQIDKAFGPEQHFILIGFSMGGLVSRVYLQDLGGAKRCDALVTISTPHHGTEAAWLHHGIGSAEMRPGSVFLNDLVRGETRLGKMPTVSYRTPLDAVIIPSDSSKWDRADNVEIVCLLHPLMTASPTLRTDLLRRFSYPEAKSFPHHEFTLDR